MLTWLFELRLLKRVSWKLDTPMSNAQSLQGSAFGILCSIPVGRVLGVVGSAIFELLGYGIRPARGNRFHLGGTKVTLHYCQDCCLCRSAVMNLTLGGRFVQQLGLGMKLD